MAWPQIIFITIMALGTGVTLAQHGDLKKDFINTAVTLLLLWWGGFFDVWLS